MHFFTNRRKPDPIARQLVSSLRSLDKLDHINKSIFPANLIYFDNKLDENKKEEFKLRLNMDNYKGSERHLKKLEFRAFAAELCTDASIRLFVSDKYSHSIPGYLSLPFNFEYKKLINYYEENKNEIFRIRQRFVDESKAADTVITELRAKFNFSEIILHESNAFEGENILENKVNMHLMLKKIKKLLIANKITNQSYSRLIINQRKEVKINQSLYTIVIDLPIKSDKEILDKFILKSYY
jgi:hypothetical protein